LCFVCNEPAASTRLFSCTKVFDITWKAAGDGIARAYGFTYDNTNRLTIADFSQQNNGSTSWTNDKVDYKVDGLAYDAGSNILTMRQRGSKIGSNATIDSLTYQYFANSNQLQKVADLSPHQGRRRGPG
jgi:hypothetical protein